MITLGALTVISAACVPPATKLASLVPAPQAARPTIIDVPDPAMSERRVKAPPFQLTASDGSGLLLSSVTTATSIEDPLALTELHLVFENPQQRPIEGRFTFSLPEGAALSRFAMKVAGAWQEAEVVEKLRARITYEDFLHRKVDPALLEQGAGNELGVRIFPIGAREKRELIVTYSESLSTDAPYRVHLAGLPRVGRLISTVHANGAAVSQLDVEKTTPDDVVVPAAVWSRGPAVALRAASSVVARVRIDAAETATEGFESAMVLVDTSASRALDLGDELAALRALARSLPAETPLRVACFDQTVEAIYSGKAGALDETTFARIRSRRALGASDLAAALAWASTAARGAGGARHRVVLLSDGVATMGASQAVELQQIKKTLRQHNVVRIDAVSFGAVRDEGALRQIVKGELESSGVVVAYEAGIGTITKKLGRKLLAPMPVAVEGADWWFPREVEAQAGDEVIVFANLLPEQRVKVKVGKQSTTLENLKGSRPFVERAVAGAKISELTSAEASDEKRRAAVALSLRHRIVSRDTAMLVLEKDSDYDRFHINRRAKVDVLAVREGRALALSHARVTPSGMAPTTSAETLLVETAESATQVAASATAQLGRVHRTKAPQVRMCASSVSGRLPPESVQRTVRANFGRFRGCYRKGLEKHPALGGRIEVRFLIGHNGSVGAVRIEESTLASAIVESCIAKQFSSLQFAMPEGGVIEVVYPLALSRDADAPSPVAIQLYRPRHYTPVDNPLPSPPRAPPSPYSGQFEEIMASIADGDLDSALTAALEWRVKSPGDVLSLLALGEVAEARGDQTLATRAYGSILELWSTRADMRRLAGERLERVGSQSALALAAQAYEGALADRPDHPSSHRLPAMLLLKRGEPKQAFELLDKAALRTFASDRFPGVREILRDDLALAAAAWVAAEPNKREAIRARLLERGITLDPQPGLHFVLVWESDTTNVDLEVVDGNGKRALTSNVTDGYGPEAFVARGADEKLAFPYDITARYTSGGNTGSYAMGKLQIIVHDGHGKLQFEERPFVVMRQGVGVSLGRVDKVAASAAVATR